MGASFLLLSLVFWAWKEGQTTQAHNSSLATPTPTISASSFGTPLRVNVPRLEIEVNVVPGIYDELNNSWNVSSTAAHFATITHEPNAEQGATLIYAHNTRRLFGPLKDIQAGDKVQVYTDKGILVEYVYTGQEIVDPSDTAIFQEAQTGAPRLVLLTCSGGWNQARRLLSFKTTSSL